MPQVSNVIVRIQNAMTDEYFDEYQIKTTGNQTECYIMSETGQKFRIFLGLHDEVRLRNPNTAFAFYVYVDGQIINASVLGRVGNVFSNEAILKGLEVELNGVAPFLFGDTIFIGKKEGQVDTEQLSKLGSIVIRIFRIASLEQSKAIPQALGGRREELKVNEKAKKALLTHTVKYGRVEKVTPTTRWITKLLDPKDKPMHTITFLYRNKNILEAMDIIPSESIERSATSSSPEDSDSEDSDTSPAASIEKIRRLKNEIRELKRKVKTEPPEKPPLFDLTGSGPVVNKRRIVVDLTI